MVEAVSNLGTVSVIRRFRPHADLQGIRADYYNLTDLQGAPLAGLLVLMDRRGRPVRAEIHVNHTAADALCEIAVRQAQRIIRDRYNNDRPIRLFPLRMQLERDPLSVQPQEARKVFATAGYGRLQKPEQRDAGMASGNALLLVSGLLLALVALLGGWFLNEWTRGDRADSGPPATWSAGEASVALERDVPLVETNGLPASRNAMPLNVGDRARLLPDIKVDLRTQAGPQAGATVADLQAPVHMTILNGPIWLQGNSDTIVWWYVRVDDGPEGWLPANTSDLTLLEPLR